MNDRARPSPFLTTLALSMLTNPAAVVAVIAPAVVGALVNAGRFSITTATLIGAAELAGMTVALLLGSLYLTIPRPRLLGAAAVVVIAASHAASALGGPLFSAAARTAAGGAEGVAYALAVAALARSAAPGRAFGIMITVNHLAGSILLAAIAWSGLDRSFYGAVAAIVIFSAAMGAFVGALPPRTNGEVRASAVDGRTPLVVALLAMLGVLLLSTGFGLVWPLIGQFAAARGLNAQEIAAALSLAGPGGILGGICAALAGGRFGRLSLVIGAGIAFALALVGPTLPIPFLVPAFAILFCWTLSLPFFLGLVSWFDRSGRLTVVASAMIPCGVAAGQAAAGLLVAAASLAAIAAAGGVAALAASGVMSVADLRFRSNPTPRENGFTC